MRGNAIVAVVGNADRHIDEFLRERIKGARSHDLLDAFPSAFKTGRIVGDSFPEIVDPIRLARGHDVVIDGANFRACFFVFDKSKGRHVFVLQDSNEMCS